MKSVSVNFKKNRLLAAAGVLLAGIALFFFLDAEAEYQKGIVLYAQIEEAAVQKIAKLPDPTKRSGEESFDSAGAVVDFESLMQMNKDIIGWILFDENGISYPVLQGKDNEEYLYKMPDGTKNDAGSIFMDAYCQPDFMDSHTILYGHNMKNSSMFGKLKKYRQEADYYQKNKYFTIFTPNATLRYEIFAWYEGFADDETYQVGFDAGDAFGSFVEQMLKRRERDTQITAGREDKIVTLSTCSVKDRRFFVLGKQILEKKEAEDETGRTKADIDETAKRHAGRENKLAPGNTDD